MHVTQGVLEGTEIEYMKTPNRGGVMAPTLIVLHDTAGTSFEGAVSWLCDRRAKASAHVVISRKGETIQLCNFEEVAWHAGKSSYKSRSGCNQFSIGIELDNPGRMQFAGNDEYSRHWAGKKYKIRKYDIEPAETQYHGHGLWMPYTEPQLHSLQNVVAAIMESYPIEDITTHWRISPGRKVDTNPLFPLSHFRSRMLGRREDERTITLLPGAQIRKWPSFYDNISGEVGETITVNVDREGVFKTEPASASSSRYHTWVYVTGELTGWVLKEQTED